MKLRLGLLLVLSPAAVLAQQTQLYWGDTHLHTANSTDAYGSGNVSIGPDEAYRFAKGEAVVHPTLGSRVRLTRPLDFLVVADHSDFLGLQVYLRRDDPRLTSTERGRRLRELVLENPASVFRMIFATNGEFTQEQLKETYRPIMMQPWLDEIAAAEKHNDPGRFTAFAGWEWSSHPRNRNLHRVVFSPGSAEQLRTFFPFSNLDSERPEDLWAWLDRTSRSSGAEFVAMPHNSNMSAGLMFQEVDSDGRSFTADYARTRARWERVVEITQVKGTSETHPALSPQDGFAGFEVLNRLFFAQAHEPKSADYVRPALLTGLKLESTLGVNPYRFGLIGSTDTHTGLSQNDEADFYGAVARDARLTERQAAPRNRPAALAVALNAWELSAAGLAGAWAAENTRHGIFEAFQRREVMASSGPRIALRMFGGYAFKSSHARGADAAAVGYRLGVPMGGELPRAPGGKAPTLLIQAMKDPQGANLDRIQVIKGWVDDRGEAREKIFDVAWSDARRVAADGQLPAVGNTVSAATASYRNSIGAANLAVVWKDPEFDPRRPAFYYARVLEIPTPRHQVYDAVALGMDPAETAQPISLQERAWSSPIWYSP